VIKSESADIVYSEYVDERLAAIEAVEVLEIYDLG